MQCVSYILVYTVTQTITRTRVLIFWNSDSKSRIWNPGKMTQYFAQRRMFYWVGLRPWAVKMVHLLA